MINNPIRAAIELAGGLSATANALKVSSSTVFRWEKARRIPKLEDAKALSKITGIPVEQLRPARKFLMGVF